MPESPPVPEAANAEPGEASLALPFDPRQGTLLGFELPADALAALTKERASAEGELWIPANAQADGVGRRNAPAGEMSLALAEPVVAVDTVNAADSEQEDEQDKQATPVDDVAAMAADKTLSAEKPFAGRPATARKAVDRAPVSDASAKPAPPEKPEKPAPPPKAASSRQAARAAVAQTADPVPLPHPVSASPAGESVVAHVGSVGSLAASEIAALARTVASLQESLDHERLAGEQRWRRTRNWLAVALAGMALVLLAFIGQTVALVGFAHRTEAAQQQALTALNEQQAALANVASATSALSARMPTLAGQTPAADAVLINAAQPPAKHAKPVHARRVKEREKEKAAAR